MCVRVCDLNILSVDPATMAQGTMATAMAASARSANLRAVDRRADGVGDANTALCGDARGLASVEPSSSALDTLARRLLVSGAPG